MTIIRQLSACLRRRIKLHRIVEALVHLVVVHLLIETLDAVLVLWQNAVDLLVPLDVLELQIEQLVIVDGVVTQFLAVVLQLV